MREQRFIPIANPMAAAKAAVKAAAKALASAAVMGLFTLSLSPEIAEAQVQRSILNPGLEIPAMTAPTASGCSIQTDAVNILGWQTTHGSRAPTGSCQGIARTTGPLVELWRSPDPGFTGTPTPPENGPAYQGRQYAELNAEQASRLYQTICLVNGEEFDWRYAHRARRGGAANQALDFNISPLPNQDGTVISSSSVTTAQGWVQRAGSFTYNGPSGEQTIGFRSRSLTQTTLGNFLDGIQIELTPYVEFQPEDSGGPESDPGSTLPTLRVAGLLENPVDIQIEVLSTSTATLGSDFTTPNGTARFAVQIPAGNYDGTRPFDLGITILEDLLIEGNETLQLRIVPTPRFFTIANVETCGGTPRGQVTYTIEDNDAEIRVQKELPDGRRAASDQFTLAITGTNGLSAVTSGSDTTVSGEAYLGNIAIDTSYTIAESMAAGSASRIGLYRPALSCTNAATGSATVLPSGRLRSATLTPRAGDRITCVFRNAIIGNPSLTIDKVVDISTVSTPQDVTYTVTIENTGDIGFDRSELVLSDALTTSRGTETLTLSGPNDDDGDDILDPDERWSYSATYAVTQADIDAGTTLTNVATVSVPTGSNPVPPVDSPQVPVDVTQSPALAIDKVVDIATVSAPQDVTYTVTVENTGNVRFAAGDVVVSDSLTTSNGPQTLTLSGPLGDDGNGTLDPAEVWSYSATYPVTQADIDAGTDLVNVATVAVPTGPHVLPPTDSPDVPVTVDQTPSLAIDKVVDQSTVTTPQEVTYTVTVENTGNVGFAAADVVLGDSLQTARGPITLTLSGPDGDDGNGRLDPAEIWTYTTRYAVTQTDIDAGQSLINVATVSVPTGPNVLPPLDSPDVPVFVTQTPLLSIDKVADVTSVSSPQDVTFTVTVTNSGNVAFAAGDVVVGDSLTLSTGDIPLALSGPTGDDGNGTLDPAEVWSYTTIYAVTQADIDAGDTLVNVATVEVPTGPNVLPPLDSPDVPVTIDQQPSLAITKVADQSVLSAPGVVNYIITVENTGNTRIAAGDVVVSDSLTTSGGPQALGLTGPTGDDGNGSLDPAESWSYTTSYAVTQADLDAGDTLVNVARVEVPTGPNVLPPRDSPDVPVTLEQNPALSITKTADVTEVSAPQEVVYTVTVENTGNVTFAAGDVVVSDSLTTARGTESLSLDPPSGDDGNGLFDPGEVWRYTTRYAVTQADIDAGRTLLNIATVAVPNGPVPLPPVVTPEVPVTVTQLPADLRLEKLAGVETAMIGDLVPYSIRATNAADGVSATVAFTDLLPEGFSYREGSVRLDGVEVSPEISGRRLTLGPVTIAPGQSRVLTLTALIGGSVRPGLHVNQARLIDPASGADLAPEATASVRVLADAMLQCATVLGRVFDDHDQNGHMSKSTEERGLPAVRLVAPNGLAITTDAHGRFNVPCAALPRNIGSNFMLKLDERSLPAGYRLTTENPRVVRLTPGMITRLDFGATLGRLVRVDLAANAFRRDAQGVRMVPELDRGLRKMVAEIRDKASMLKITYVLARGESEAQAKARIELVEQALRDLWRSNGRYKLNIETVIERAGVGQ